MSRSRIALNFDHDAHIFVVRYFGEIEGSAINKSLLEQLVQVDQVWTYDCLIDMRRFDGTVLIGEIEDLSHKWGLFAQGRDRGRFTAIVSDDTLVKARLPVTQSLFPTRIIEHFFSFDEGLDWLKTQRDYQSRALAG